MLLFTLVAMSERFNLNQLFPAPQNLTWLAGKHRALRWHLITTTATWEALQPSWPWLQNLYPILKKASLNPVKTVSELELHLDNAQPREAFQLMISSERIEIRACDPRGFFYGLHGLGQVFNLAPSLPCLVLQSQPSLPNRGYMLDLSRCKVPKLSSLKELIDQLARLHYNHLQLYIEHTYAFKDHVQVWGDSSPLTQKDLLELDQHCRDRFIELVPNLNSFGHFERWLKHKPYQHLAECPTGFTSPFGDFRPVGSVLKPNAKSLAFIDALYHEYLPNFKSDCFNVGCDETFELGQGHSKHKVQKEGVHQVYFQHLLNIQKLVKQHHRKMMFWADILIESPTSIAKLPNDITALIWGYEPDHPFLEQCSLLQSTQANYWVCPGTSAWNSLLGRWDDAQVNITQAYRNGKAHQCTGLLLTDWGDGGHHQVTPISWPALVYTAQLTWSDKTTKAADLAHWLNYFYFPKKSKLGSLLVNIGSSHSKLKRPSKNSTIYHQLLFKASHGFEQIPNSALNEHLEQLQAYQTQTEKDNSLEGKELRLALTLAQLALQRYQSLTHAIPFPQAEAVKAIGQYEKLWIQRNRIGGLHESSTKLRQALSLCGFTSS